MWLTKDNKYANKNLLTCSKSTVVEVGKDSYLEIMETIQQQIVEANNNERIDALKKVKQLSKEFVFIVRTLKGSLAEGWGKL